MLLRVDLKLPWVVNTYLCGSFRPLHCSSCAILGRHDGNQAYIGGQGQCVRSRTAAETLRPRILDVGAEKRVEGRYHSVICPSSISKVRKGEDGSFVMIGRLIKDISISRGWYFGKKP